MDKKKKLLVVLILVGAVMIGLLALTVALTGGREPSEFTGRDKVIFWAFVAAELALLILELVLADRAGKLNRASDPALQQIQPPGKAERCVRRRALFLQALAILLTIAFRIVGQICGRDLSKEQRQALLLPMLSILGAVLLLSGLNLLLHAWITRRLTRMPVAETQQWLQSHREKALVVAGRKLRELRRVRIVSLVYALLLAAMGLALAFLYGMSRIGVPWFLFLAVILTDLGVTRFPFKTPESVLEEVENELEERDFPELFRLARRAAAAHGRRNRIRIFATTDCNAGIGHLGSVDMIQMGMLLLGLLHEKELYAILLHEFSHLGDERLQREADYSEWQQNCKNRHLLAGLSKLLFSTPDDWYSLQYGLFRFASSLDEETRADRAMAELGDGRSAASALIKLKYAELHLWEDEGVDQPDPHSVEDFARHFVSGRIEALRKAVRERAPFYNELIRVEIQARSASHPILRSRLKNLGEEELIIREEEDPRLYLDEVRLAIERTEERIKGINNEEKYRAYRAKQLKIVEDWETAGRPLQQEAYPETVSALKEMGRLDEAMELCDRAIAELPEEVSISYALHMKGCCLLHRWDAAGIDFIYRAIENNSNYLQEGLEQIGQFCCLTGNQTELERYRVKATELGQQEKDVFSKLSVLRKGDRLTGEILPPPLEQKLRESLAELDEGRFEAIYLLHKQISEEFSTSPMVVHFRAELPEEEKNELMHRIFLLLDAVRDWQFSLFDYHEVKKLKIEEIKGALFYMPKE
jgi:Zn-dependent protease with chaperone function